MAALEDNPRTDHAGTSDLPDHLSTDRHSHATGADRCPLCEQTIPTAKFAEIRERISAREQAKHQEVMKQLKTEFAAERAAIETRIRAEAKQEIETALSARLKAAEEARATLQTTLNEQKEAFEQARTVAVLAEQAKAFDERQKLQEKLTLLQKQLENKTAQEIGEGPEVDLFEQLREAFEGDRIRRVAKGAQGADVIHEVVRNGQVCGKIIYDSKARNAWKNEYVSKLRADQLNERAEHAVLSSTKLPAGKQQLHVQDGVIVANPARVIALVDIIRRHIIETNDLRVGNEEREEKTAQLYEFIISDRCKQLLEQIEMQTQRMHDLDTAEEKAHKLTWDRRNKLIRSVQKAHNDLCFEIERVIGTQDQSGGIDP